jgi:protein-disulfide isomerase
MSEKKKFELSPSVSILIAGVIIAGAIVFVNAHPNTAATAAAANAPLPTPTTLTIRPPSSSDHLIGSANAPIVLVEYSDFQCPFCSMIHPSLKNIVDASNGQVAWVQREFPLTSIHPQAEPAALAAECISHLVGNDAYWKYADTVFSNQAQLTPAYSAQLAAQLGADPAKFAQCVSAKTYQSVIDTDTSEAESNGGNGTPFTVVVNTKTGKMVPISGAVPQAQIEQIINSLK